MNTSIARCWGGLGSTGRGSKGYLKAMAIYQGYRSMSMFNSLHGYIHRFVLTESQCWVFSLVNTFTEGTSTIS